MQMIHYQNKYLNSSLYKLIKKNVVMCKFTKLIAFIDLENRRVLFDLKKNNLSGFPDGMTIDKDGNLWIASFMGHQVFKI